MHRSFVLNWVRISLHFIKACPDLPWLDQIYCSGYKLYCRRYWPDLPEMCRKWPRKKKTDRTNNFLQSAFFPPILLLSFNDTLWTLVLAWQMFLTREKLCYFGFSHAKKMSEKMFQIVSSYKSPGKSFHPSPWDLQSRRISRIRLFPSISKQIPAPPPFPTMQCFVKRRRMGHYINIYINFINTF